MPRSGLDSSWAFAMNHATAHGLEIGTEIVFTYGPYSGVYTRLYQPEISHLILFSSIFLSLCFSIAFLMCSHTWKSHIAILLLLLFLGSVSAALDAILLAYPLIFLIFIHRITAIETDNRSHFDQYTLSALIPLSGALGFIPLIKGSFLLFSVIAAGLSVGLLIFRHRFLYATTCLAGIIVSAVSFWIMSGQSPGNLTDYITSMTPVVSGYTEGMSMKKDFWTDAFQIITYLLIASFILFLINRSQNLAAINRAFLLLSFALFFFICFKAGFVRHDHYHATIPYSAAAIALCFFGLIGTTRRFLLATIVTIPLLALGNPTHSTKIAQNFPEHFFSTYSNAWAGLLHRTGFSEDLQTQYDSALKTIRAEYQPPDLHGRIDLYSCDQAYVLASGLDWQPRPVFQSYSVYTPGLAEINEKHLRGTNRPDAILFTISPIDDRHPAIEDGLSWPALFDNYRITGQSGNFVILSQRRPMEPTSSLYVISTDRYRIGDIVTLSTDDERALFAKIRLEPTRLGKILSVIFKLPELYIDLALNNGTQTRYRLIAGMAASGFVISPLIRNVTDFSMLASGRHEKLKNQQVSSFRITPSYGGSWLWRSTYQMQLQWLDPPI
jgi:hypothetical protein